METLLLSLIATGILINIIISLKKGNGDISDIRQNIINQQQSLWQTEQRFKGEFERLSQKIDSGERENRNEITLHFNIINQTLSQSIDKLAGSQKVNLEMFAKRLHEIQLQIEQSAKSNREELSESVKNIGITVNKNLEGIRDENAKKLEEIRIIVDDKLKETIEKRFSDSFKLIGDRLEQVHKGLGEMQQLATGVGDLKKVLRNVKTRGNLGEVRLESILCQILSPEQYVENAAINPETQQRVEFAIKLPGNGDKNESLLLPIDSKFPLDAYQHLYDAYESGNGIDEMQKKFESAVKKNAEDISKKYILPPYTTDFAVMFVASEGIYAEIIRRTDLFEMLRRDYHITVTGPTNLAAFLSSLQMGFRTLAIQKRSAEVWNVLSGVKTEFGKFGDILEKTRKKLTEAANNIDSVSVRSRAIERKLRDVQALPDKENSVNTALDNNADE